MKRSRRPGIQDVQSEDRPDGVRAASIDPDLDRDYRARGPVLNRWVVHCVRSTLQFDGRSFPTMLSRNDGRHLAERDRLWIYLDGLSGELTSGPGRLEPLAEYVRGDGAVEDGGRLVQQVVGSLFSPAYQATEKTWAAAVLLNQAAHTVNPARRARWRITGELQAARRTLAEPVGSDLAAIHATGVALHNIVKAMQTMRELYGSGPDAALKPEAAVLRCLAAPTVIRQPVAERSDGPLVVLQLDAAFKASGDSDLVFMRNTWAQCPAESWVPALLTGTWRRAQGIAQPAAEVRGCPAHRGD
jgi:hypothetical protein